MQIKTVNATLVDQGSALTLFSALFDQRRLMFKKPEGVPIRVLDAFARNGQLTVKAYRDRGVVFDAWELAAEHERDLEFAGARDVRIGCSYDTVGHAVAQEAEYDLLVIDTPQGLHKSADGQVRVEHFAFLNHALPLVSKGGVVVLYVNKSPYDKNKVGEHGYDQYYEYDYQAWMAVRFVYYGTSVITEEQAIMTYRQQAALQGMKITHVLTVPCESDVPGLEPYAFRLAMRVEPV